MDNFVLFIDSSGKEYTHKDILLSLHEIQADDAETLFIHTDVMFGKPAPQLKRKEYLDNLYNVLLEMGVKTLIFPAFSYSFCNNEDYDVRNSRTSMGALIEYIRKQRGVYRTLDPLLSFLVVGEEKELFAYNIGHNALGRGSGFDLLHKMDNIKFLFFGADFSEYFTYIHHIEKILEVPYRYDQLFSGTIIDYNGNKFYHEHYIHTACSGVKLKNFSGLKKELSDKGCLKSRPLGDLEVVCVAEQDVYKEVCDKIAKDPYSFVEPYRKSDLVHEYTFGKNGERVTHC